MKTVILFFAILFTVNGLAQTAKDTSLTFEVNGNCDMCKSNIEKAAKKAGASIATWNMETHVLTINYNAKKTTVAKIQKAIAKVGYDNVGATATNASYDKLHGCCKYARKAFTKTS